MENMQKPPNSQVADSEAARLPLVNAQTIGARYGVTGRYVLQLAAEKKLPCLRLGKKCVRFDPVAVAKALNDPNFGKGEKSE